MTLLYTNIVLEMAGRVHWQDKVISTDDIETFIDKLEERTGFKFRATKEEDIVNGFVTNFEDGYIISIYGVDKKPDKENPHTFVAVKVNKAVEEAIYGKV